MTNTKQVGSNIQFLYLRTDNGHLAWFAIDDMLEVFKHKRRRHDGVEHFDALFVVPTSDHSVQELAETRQRNAPQRPLTHLRRAKKLQKESA